MIRSKRNCHLIPLYPPHKVTLTHRLRNGSATRKTRKTSFAASNFQILFCSCEFSHFSDGLGELSKAKLVISFSSLWLRQFQAPSPCRVCRVNALQFKCFDMITFQTPAVTIYHVVLRQMLFSFWPKLLELRSTFDPLNVQPA